MRRILIGRSIGPDGEFDLHGVLDPAGVCQTLRSNPVNINSGNNLWFQGLVSTLLTPESHVEFLTRDMSVEYINDHFDAVVKPHANVFAPRFVGIMEDHVRAWKGLKIPMYIVACGAQADSYDRLDELAERIRTPACRFMDSVYATGGEFALRGHFTKAFFDRLGYPTAEVTGCPSLYQCGRDLRIHVEKVPRAAFRPVVNGRLDLVEPLLREDGAVPFIDQGDFLRLLHDPAFRNEHDLGVRDMVGLLEHHGAVALRMMRAGRVHHFHAMPEWRNFLMDHRFSFSFGSRMHGNIMAILAGIPAVICACDARTRELAEFHGIPLVPKGVYDRDRLYELYARTDYGAFNRGFAARYDRYEDFLVRHRLAERINPTSAFFASERRRPDAPPVNRAFIGEINDKLDRLGPLYRAVGWAVGMKRRLGRILRRLRK